MINYMERRIYPRLTETPSGCWAWQGALTPKGYGRAYGNRLVHHLTWADLRGPVPDGLILDHTCFVRSCANPWHLDPIPVLLNSSLERREPRTTCNRGHDLALVGFALRSNGKRTVRTCRACRAAS